MLTTDLDTLCVNTLRFLAVDAVEKANSGHPGTPMEAAPLGHVLWTKVLRHNPQNPQWPNRDRFVLSAGHASMLLYGLLHLTGYDVSLDDLKAFRQWGSLTPGHPEFGHTPGVETTTGPLGQGFATGVGLALAERLLAARFNRPGFPIVDHRVFAFVSDGDLMEGLSAEAASLAGHLQLGKLKYLYLDNRITIEGSTDLAFSEDVGKRFESCGWAVLRLPEVNDVAAVERVFDASLQITDKPTLIIARTHIGFGSPHKQDSAEAHGAPLGAAETLATKKNLGWPETPTFYVPDAVRQHMGEVVARGAAQEKAWLDLFSRYQREFPDLAREWQERQKSPLTEGWEKALPVFPAGEGLATRQASGKILNALAPVLPALVGGSADLAPSNNTRLEKFGDQSPQTPDGRNFHFGIREHAMGAALNGLGVDGRFLPFGGTFLVFSDYMRSSIRLAALMKIGVIYVFTHDSIGVGEDGPTHQPVEHVAALRCIPNLCVLRPADANETAWAWRVALERRKGPTALILTRQKLPVYDRTVFASAQGVQQGAYLLTLGNPSPDLLLLASGSEVSLAVAAADRLKQAGHRPSMVSFPSWELFEAQPESYRNAVLPPNLTARVAIEAGSSQGWHKYVGSSGRLITLDRFGASAPGDRVMAEMGFTVDNIVRESLSLVGG
jgi:transketolase